MEYVNGGELFFHLSKERQFSEVNISFKNPSPSSPHISPLSPHINGHKPNFN